MVVFWASAVQATNNAGGAFTAWPDTGQSTCYNNTGEIPSPAEGQAFHGQDAQYQGPARSYTSLGGGTMVRDNVTGLIWEVKENGDGTPEYSNPHDPDNYYTWCDTDPATNGGNQGTCGAHDTEDFIDALNNASFGGHTDWRLPTLKELATLVDYTRVDPATDTVFFPNIGADNYWSATTDASDSKDAWYVNFIYGFYGNTYKSSNYRVRAVRGGSGSTASFTDNGDGTDNQ